MVLNSIERFFLTLEVDMHSMTVILIKDGKEGRTYDSNQYFQYFVEYGVRKSDVALLQEHFSIDYFQDMLVTGKKSEVFEFCVKFVGEDYKFLECKMKPVEIQNNSIIRITLEDISHKRVQKLIYIKEHFTKNQHKSYVKPFDIKFEEEKNINKEKQKIYKHSIVLVSILCILFTCIFLSNVYSEKLNKSIEETAENSKTTTWCIEHELNDLAVSLVNFRNLISSSENNVTKNELENYVEQSKKDYDCETMIFIDKDYKSIYSKHDIDSESISYLANLLKYGEEYAIIATHVEGKTLVNYIISAQELNIEGEKCKFIIGVFDLNNIANSAYVNKVSKKYDSMIINKEGNILWSASPDISKIINHRNFSNYLENKLVKVLPENGVEELNIDLKREKEGALSFITEGQRKFVAYEPLMIEDLFLVSISKNKKIDLIEVNNIIFLIIILALILMFPIFILLYKMEKIKDRKNCLEELAYYDEITGATNINYFDEKAKTIIREMECHYALVITNLHNFSLYNARYGNVKGDELIRRLFLGISKYIDTDELVCRSYAEHMIIMMKYEGENQLEDRLVSIGSCIIDTSFRLEYGICIIRDLTMELDVAKERAGMALKGENKKIKSNVSIAYYDVKLLEKVLFEKELEKTMYRAFRKGEFKLFVEPRYDLKTRALCNGDAYAVWNHPEKGSILPEQYIRVFERKGLIMCLDSFIFEEVCKKIKEQLEKEGNCVHITIKLHRNHFNIPKFFSKFQRIKDTYDISGDCLSFEISEEIMCEKINQIEKVIESIHKMGAKCIMGEYRGRYMTLDTLCKLGVDIIKFEPELLTNELPNEMINAVIKIAKAANAKTIATGICKQSQVSYLSRIGCDEAKGDVFAKNISLDEYVNIF